MREIGIGIVGCGFIGRLQALSFETIEGVNVVAVNDTNQDAAVSLAAELDCAVEEQVSDLAKRTDVDLVIVATPNNLHVAPVLDSIRAGKHVLVEKPMALSRGDCARMQQAALDSGVRLLVGHVIRLFPAAGEMRRLVTSGEIGNPVAARATRMRWRELQTGPANWWKLDRASSGGDLFHQIHELDLLCWNLGKPKSVFARTGNLAHPEMPSYDDVIHLSLRFSNGALATLESGSAYHLSEWGVKVYGTKGACSLDLTTGDLTVYYDDGKQYQRRAFDDDVANNSLAGVLQKDQLSAAGSDSTLGYGHISTAAPYWMAHALELQAMSVIGSVRDGLPTPLADYQDWAVTMAEASLESIQTGCEVVLSDEVEGGSL